MSAINSFEVIPGISLPTHDMRLNVVEDTVNFTSTPENAQATLDGMSRYMHENRILTITAGTSPTTLLIPLFFGPGQLRIQTSGVVTFNSIYLSDCVNSRIEIVGPLILNAANAAKLLVMNCLCSVIIRNSVNFHGGINTNANNIGLFAERAKGGVYISGCGFNDQNICVLSNQQSVVSVGNLSGPGNNIAYLARNSGVIAEHSAVRPTAITTRSVSTAGMIITEPGQIIGE